MRRAQAGPAGRQRRGPEALAGRLAPRRRGACRRATRQPTRLGGQGSSLGAANARATSTAGFGQQALSTATGTGAAASSQQTHEQRRAVCCGVAEQRAVVVDRIGGGRERGDVGAVSGFLGTTEDAYAVGTITPTASFLSTALSGHSNVNTALSGAQAAGGIFGAGVLGAAYATGATGSQEYIDTETFTLNGYNLGGHLILGLLDTQTSGSGFSSLVFTVTVGGVTKVSQSFSTVAAANTYFSNDAIDLGAVPTTPALQVVVKFDLTTSTAGSGYGEDFILGAQSVVPPRNNFLGHGQSDFVIENTGSSAGLVGIGEVVNGQVAFTFPTALDPSQYHILGSGDFLGDGKSDLLIENIGSSAGLIGIGEISNGQVAFTFPTNLTPSGQWNVAGTGDFLGDGKDQFLIENTGSNAGLVGIGELNNGHVAFTFPTSLSTSQWSIVGTGDFLGDGKSDILVENIGSNAGLVGIGEVSNGQVAFTFPTAVTLSQWKFVGSGDFLGDGKDQFLIENIGSNAGLLGIGEVTGGQVAFTFPTNLASQWTIVGTGDYLAEGHDQFLIENTSGAIDIGDFTGGQIHLTQVSTIQASQWMFH